MMLSKELEAAVRAEVARQVRNTLAGELAGSDQFWDAVNARADEALREMEISAELVPGGFQARRPVIRLAVEAGNATAVAELDIMSLLEDATQGLKPAMMERLAELLDELASAARRPEVRQ